MSTSEKWTVTHSPCPCGNGRIAKDVDSPDNPWSRPSAEFRLDCPECEKVWVLNFSGSELQNRVASEESSAAFHRIYEIEKALEPLVREAIDRIVSEAGFPDFKTEREFLLRAGACSEGPIRYKRARQAGASASSMCNSFANLGWVVCELRDRQLAGKIEQLTKERETWQTARADAQKRLEPIAINSLRLA